MINFGEYYSLEQYKKMYSIRNNKDNSVENSLKSINRNKYQDEFDISLVNFLKEKNKNNELLHIDCSDGHETRFQSYWNKFLKEDFDSYINFEICSILSGYNFLLYHNIEKKEENETFYIEKYNELIKKYSNGNFSYQEISSHINCTCEICDQRMNLLFNNWKPSFKVLKNTNDVVELTNPDSCLNNNNIELPFTFKTNELLIADWFRIKEFTNSVEYQGSINSGLGVINSVKNSLSHGFISVVLSNCSPNVYQSENMLIFGENDDSELNIKGFNKVGNVCTDLWAATIIEKERLIEIVVSQVGIKGVDIVEKYLKDNDVLRLNINPGEYILEFNFNYENFADNILKKEEYPNKIEPYFSIKKNNVEPTLKNQSKNNKFKK